MKRSCSIAVLLAAVTILNCPRLRAQSIPGLYFKADAGGVITEPTSLKEFFGPVTPGSRVKFDPGVRFGFGAGYELTSWFAVEGEIGAMANNISSITDATRVDAVLSNVPFLANVRFQCPHHCKLTPYIGGGLGVSGAILDANRITINNVSMEGTASDAVFAYQAFAGLTYRFNDTMSLGAEYRYFVAESPSWQADFALTQSDRMSFGGTRSHAISVAFHFIF
jgi:opacity protein-like surface antigen